MIHASGRETPREQLSRVKYLETRPRTADYTYDFTRSRTSGSLLKRVDGFPKLHHSTASLNQAASRALKTTELSSKKSDGKRGGAPRRLLSKKSITGLFKTAARFAVQHDHLKGKSFEQILENFDTTVQKAGWSKHGNKWQRSYSPDRFGDIPPVEDSIYLNEQSEPSKAKALGTEDDVLEEKKPRRSSLGSLTLQSPPLVAKRKARTNVMQANIKDKHANVLRSVLRQSISEAAWKRLISEKNSEDGTDNTIDYSHLHLGVFTKESVHQQLERENLHTWIRPYTSVGLLDKKYHLTKKSGCSNETDLSSLRNKNDDERKHSENSASLQTCQELHAIPPKRRAVLRLEAARSEIKNESLLTERLVRVMKKFHDGPQSGNITDFQETQSARRKKHVHWVREHEKRLKRVASKKLWHEKTLNDSVASTEVRQKRLASESNRKQRLMKLLIRIALVSRTSVLIQAIHERRIQYKESRKLFVAANCIAHWSEKQFLTSRIRRRDFARERLNNFLQDFVKRWKIRRHTKFVSRIRDFLQRSAKVSNQCKLLLIYRIHVNRSIKISRAWRSYCCMQKERINILSERWKILERRMLEISKQEERKARTTVTTKRRSTTGAKRSSVTAKEKKIERFQDMLPSDFRKKILKQDLMYRRREWLDRKQAYNRRIEVLKPYVVMKRRELEIEQRLAFNGALEQFCLDDTPLQKLFPPKPQPFSFSLSDDQLKTLIIDARSAYMMQLNFSADG